MLFVSSCRNSTVFLATDNCDSFTEHYNNLFNSSSSTISSIPTFQFKSMNLNNELVVHENYEDRIIYDEQGDNIDGKKQSFC